MDNYKLLVKPGTGEWIPDPRWDGSQIWEWIPDPRWDGSQIGEWITDPDTWGGNVAKPSEEENEKMLFDISVDPEERLIS